LGRKVHPFGFRLGYIKDWRSRWFAEGARYREQLAEDLEVRKAIQAQIGEGSISDVTIERYPKQVAITIHTAKPGIVIGRKGAHVNALRKSLEIKTGKKIDVEVKEVTHPELDAYLVAESIVNQIERRISHKRAMKQAVIKSMRAGAQGIKIVCSGRLSGAEMARREWVSEGRVPRQTLRADIDFARAEALTTYGRIGIKVWIYRGEVLPGTPAERPAASAEETGASA